MLYPILKINQLDSISTQIIDSDFPYAPVLELESIDKENTICTFLTLMRAFCNQYNCGYDNGYVDGTLDAREIEE